jgi:S-disulfanyl-L-cysteine oxidoreductase SoxD
MSIRIATRNLGVIGFAVIAGIAFAGALDAGERTQAPARTSPISTMTGVYTPAQAARGEATYLNVCAGCHSARNYASQGFTQEWSGHRLADLFDYLRGAMPKGDPGSVSAAEHAQVIAYLLKINRVPAGKVELPAERSALQSIVIEFPSAR